MDFSKFRDKHGKELRCPNTKGKYGSLCGSVVLPASLLPYSP